MVRTAALILALTIGTPAASETGDAPPPFDAEAKAIVIAAVKDRLLDGEAARWRWLPAKGEEQVAQYCGFINAKNRMGAYTGFNPFWITGYWKSGQFTAITAEFAQGPYLDGFAARKCIGAGYPMDKIPPE